MIKLSKLLRYNKKEMLRPYISLINKLSPKNLGRDIIYHTPHIANIIRWKIYNYE